MYHVKDDKKIHINEKSCMIPNLKTEHLFTKTLLSRKITEEAIENFKSHKFIFGSENSQKRYNYIKNMNVVGQRCADFFVCFYR